MEETETQDVVSQQVPDRVTHLYTWLCRYESGLTMLIGSYMTELEAQTRRPTLYENGPEMTLIRVRLP